MKNASVFRLLCLGVLLCSTQNGCGGGSYSGGGNPPPPPPTPSIVVFAGTGNSGYTGDGGLATSATLNSPYGVWGDANGNIYIADTGNSVIRKVDSTGKINTIAGNGNNGFSGDGGAATSATLYRPYRAVADKFGNVYIADFYNNVIRKVDTSGNIATVAGTGTQGYNGDNIPATSAQLSTPSAVAVDGSGNLYISDTFNNRIRKVDSTGTITTIAGTGFAGVLGDGGAADLAQVNEPEGVAVDSNGNIFIVDYGNCKIRKVDTNGMINTFAGNGVIGFSGDGGLATSAALNQPTGVAVDKQGNVYIADNQNGRIRKVTSAGTISTIISTSTPGVTQLFFPEDVFVDSSGHIFIADTNNMRVLEFR